MSMSKLWEIVKDREAWPAVVHAVTKSQTRLSNWTTTSSSLRNEALTDGPNFTKFHYLADSCSFFILHTDRATDEVTMEQTFTPSPHFLFPGSNSLPQLLDANLGPVTISGLRHRKQTIMLRFGSGHPCDLPCFLTWHKTWRKLCLALGVTYLE